MVDRKGWLIGGAAVLVLAVSAGVHFWRVQRPPAPSAARLPPSARVLLQPFRKDSLKLTVGPHEELSYRVGMQAGASLVYAWSTGDPVSFEFAEQGTNRAAEAHSAFVAQSAGWYRWHWKNSNSHPVTIRFKMSGYYEPALLPPASMPYDR